jgi:hypothetical protein
MLSGDCRWNARNFIVPVTFRYCTIDRELSLTGATVPDIRFHRCLLRGIKAQSLRVGLTFRVTHCRSSRLIDISDSEIAGFAYVIHTNIGNPSDSGNATGIPRKLSKALSAQRARVTGDLRLGDCTFHGEVDLRSARLGGLDLRGARARNKANVAIQAEGIRIGGNAFLNKGFSAEGKVSFNNAVIDGQLVCRDADFQFPGRRALAIEGATVRQGVYLKGSFSTHGTVSLIGSTMDLLDCDGASISAPHDYALYADRIVVRGDVRLTGGFQASGKVSFLDSKLGNIICTGAILRRNVGTALSLDRSAVTGSVFISEGFDADGTVRLMDASIGGQLDCHGARFDCPAGNAILADGLSVGASMDMSEGLVALGTVSLRSAHIGKSLYLNRTTIDKADGVALDGEGLVVVDALVLWRMAKPPEGIIDLTRATVGELRDDRTSWPPFGRLRLNGFVYSELSDRTRLNARARLEWLGRQAAYTPQPYEQLKALYRRYGQETEARSVAIGKQEARRKRGQLGWWDRTTSWLLGLTIGHGYRPWRLAVVLLVLYLASALLINVAADRNAFVPVSSMAVPSPEVSRCTAEYPCLSVWSYPIDAVVPIVNLGQDDYWQPDASQRVGQIVRDFLYIVTMVGWGSTTLLVAAFTGIVRRE